MNSGTIYKLLVYGIMTAFLALLFTVGYIANSRQSGRTGLDTAQMQVTRAGQQPVATTSP
jgi:hypothetical protein